MGTKCEHPGPYYTENRNRNEVVVRCTECGLSVVLYPVGSLSRLPFGGLDLSVIEPRARRLLREQQEKASSAAYLHLQGVTPL